MNKILSARSMFWGVFLAYSLFEYIAWKYYDARYLEPGTAIVITGYLLLGIFLLLSIIRCRALSWSGWRVLAYVVPLAGLLLLLLLLFKKTDTWEGIA